MIYVCEYDNSTANQTLLEAAELLFPNENVISIKEEDKTGIRWIKLRERILAWMLLEYALEKEGDGWIKGQTNDRDVDNLGVGAEGLCEEHAGIGADGLREEPAKNGSVTERLEIVRTEHGKPYSSRYPELFFNISHCDTACACVLSDCPVGIDIERKFEYKENLKRHICCEEEQCIMEDANGTKESVFIKQGREQNCSENVPVYKKHLHIGYEKEGQLRFLWSMKEAFVKMDGRGLGYGMKNIDLSGILPMQEGKWKSAGDGGCFMVKTGTDYTLAVCREKKGDWKEPVILKERELIRTTFQKVPALQALRALSGR